MNPFDLNKHQIACIKDISLLVVIICLAGPALFLAACVIIFQMLAEACEYILSLGEPLMESIVNMRENLRKEYFP